MPCQVVLLLCMSHSCNSAEIGCACCLATLAYEVQVNHAYPGGPILLFTLVALTEGVIYPQASPATALAFILFSAELFIARTI